MSDIPIPPDPNFSDHPEELQADPNVGDASTDPIATRIWDDRGPRKGVDTEKCDVQDSGQGVVSTIVPTGCLSLASNHLEWAWRQGTFLKLNLVEQFQVLGNLQFLQTFLPAPT